MLPEFWVKAAGRRQLTTVNVDSNIDEVGLRGKSGVHF